MAKNGYIKKVAGVTGFAVLFGAVSSGIFVSLNAAQGVNTPNASVTAETAEKEKTSLETAVDKVLTGSADGEEVQTILTDKVISSASAGQEMSVPDVVDNSMPAMVSITNTSVESLEDYFGNFGSYGDFFGSFGGFGSYGGRGGNGGQQEYTSVSAGSGVIIGETDDTIIIATNQHVIADTKELSVAFVNDTAASATVLGEDEKTDLAVISVKKSELDADTLKAIRVISIGNSDDLRIGEEIVCIGNALGYGQSVSTGVVSAKNRVVTDEYGNTEGTENGLIQTDAAINPGNSGGGMFNLKGELVGINSAKDVDTKVEGMCYAIPIADALPILENLKLGESVQETPATGSTVRLGISCSAISSEYASYYGVPAGIYVNEVEEGSAAANAGMQSGDILTAIDGNETMTMDGLSKLLSGYKAGDTVTLTIQREQETTARSFNPSGQGSIEAPKTYAAVELTLTFQSSFVQTSTQMN